MGRELMAPRTDRTTRVPSSVEYPVAANHAAEGPVFINLRNAGNLKIGTQALVDRTIERILLLRQLPEKLRAQVVIPLFFFFTPMTGPRRSLGLELSDTRVYALYTRACLGNHNTPIFGASCSLRQLPEKLRAQVVIPIVLL